VRRAARVINHEDREAHDAILINRSYKPTLRVLYVFMVDEFMVDETWRSPWLIACA
jgi:hypothetical protein